MSTTSARCGAGDVDRLDAVGRLADHRRCRAARRRSWRSRCARAPGRRPRPPARWRRPACVTGRAGGGPAPEPAARRCGPASSVPPSTPTRSRMPDEPEPGRPGAGHAAAPSSDDGDDQRVVVDGHVDVGPGGAGRVAQHVGQRLLDDPVGRRGRRPGRPAGTGSCGARVTARPARRTTVGQLVERGEVGLRRRSSRRLRRTPSIRRSSVERSAGGVGHRGHRRTGLRRASPRAPPARPRPARRSRSRGGRRRRGGRGRCAPARRRRPAARPRRGARRAARPAPAAPGPCRRPPSAVIPTK